MCIYVKHLIAQCFRICLALVNIDVFSQFFCEVHFIIILSAMLIVVVLSLSPDLRTYEFGSGDLPPMLVRWVVFNNLLGFFTFELSLT